MFEALFKKHVTQSGMKYVGFTPIECNDFGEPVNKSKVPKGYTKEYIKTMKEFEQELLNEKAQIVKDQNKEYYNSKCKELLSKSDEDSFCKAAANLMLNSGSEYLVELEKQYKGKLVCTDLNLLNEGGVIPVDEQQVNDMIEKVVNQK
jgi:hypothetical protein